MGMTFAFEMSMGEDAIGTWGEGDDSITKIGAAVCGGGGGVWTSFRRLNFISKIWMGIKRQLGSYINQNKPYS
jgi:hypothetical protein